MGKLKRFCLGICSAVSAVKILGIKHAIEMKMADKNGRNEGLIDDNCVCADSRLFHGGGMHAGVCDQAG